MKGRISTVFSTAAFGIGCALLAALFAWRSSILINGIQLKYALCGLLLVGALSSFWGVISAFRQ